MTEPGTKINVYVLGGRVFASSGREVEALKVMPLRPLRCTVNFANAARPRWDKPWIAALTGALPHHARIFQKNRKPFGNRAGREIAGHPVNGQAAVMNLLGPFCWVRYKKVEQACGNACFGAGMKMTAAI